MTTVVDDPRTAALWARQSMGCALVPRSLIRVTDTGDQFINCLLYTSDPGARGR